MLPRYDTKLFCDIYDNAEDFVADCKDNGIPNLLTDTSLTTLYYLLYAKYGNNPIANFDETQFKYKLFANIFQFGPTWEKKLDVQAKLRALTDEDLMKGSKAIYNHAYNPSTTPSTATLEELTTINDQNTTNYKKSKLEGYALLLELLESDVTGAFLETFCKLFKVVVAPERTHIYVTECEEEEEDDE